MATQQITDRQTKFSKITLDEQSSTPPTPDSGKAVVYVKSDGYLYYLDDTGTERRWYPPIVDNDVAYQGKDSSNTARNIAKVDTSDNLQIGDSNLGFLILNNIPKVDTINEKTAGGGVTVDNCLIKDGLVSNSDKVDGYHIYSHTVIMTLTANSYNTITHNLGTTSRLIFAINGDYGANAFLVRGIRYLDENSFEFYADGGSNSAARINYVIFY